MKFLRNRLSTIKEDVYLQIFYLSTDTEPDDPCCRVADKYI